MIEAYKQTDKGASVSSQMLTLMADSLEVDSLRSMYHDMKQKQAAESKKDATVRFIESLQTFSAPTCHASGPDTRLGAQGMFVERRGEL